MSSLTHFLLVWGTVTSYQGKQTTLTPEGLQELRQDVRNLILANEVGLTNDSPNVHPFDLILGLPNDYVLLASFVRLAFHDCAGTGICDGCIDLDSSDNAGLEEGAIEPLSDLCDYNNNQYGLSYADCWALAATFAVELSGDLTDGIPELGILGIWQFFALTGFPAANPTVQVIFQGDIPYFVGRRDCPFTPNVRKTLHEEFADPEGSWSSAQEFLKDKFPDMSTKETVALMAGGHSIGRGHMKLSGFSGAWGNSQSVVDTDYLSVLINPVDILGFPVNWEQGRLDETQEKVQFLVDTGIPPDQLFILPNPKVFLMLNVDISLGYDISYYINNGLQNEIDCQTGGAVLCAQNYPDKPIVLGPGETGDEYDPDLICPIKQCPVNCEGGQTVLDNYINTNFVDLDDNDDSCIAAFLQQMERDQFDFGHTFTRAFTKMITAGYRTAINGKGKKKIQLDRITLPSA